MSIGTAALTAALTRATKTLIVSGNPAWFRNLLTLTLTGFAPSSSGNIVALIYRGNTLVALNAASFSGPDAGCTGTIDLNTEELEDAFSEAGTPTGGICEFTLYVFDTSIPDLLAFGTVEIRQTRDYTTISTVPTAPLSDTTVFIGSFAFYDGKTYIRSKTDGLYYEFQAAGAGEEVGELLDTTGITIPGAP